MSLKQDESGAFDILLVLVDIKPNTCGILKVKLVSLGKV